MTRKDYKAIAAILNTANQKRGECPPSWTAYEIARSLAYLMREDNPHFDPVKFQEACGMKVCAPFIDDFS